MATPDHTFMDGGSAILFHVVSHDYCFIPFIPFIPVKMVLVNFFEVSSFWTVFDFAAFYHVISACYNLPPQCPVSEHIAKKAFFLTQ
jgi:hypothetical protein